MRKLSMRTDPTNDDSNRVKQIIRIFDHPKNLLEVLRTRLPIYQGLTGNNIKTGPKQYRFTWNFLYGEALRIFWFKVNWIASQNCRQSNFSNGSCYYLFWTKIVPLQAEVLHPLQNGETPQEHHKAVCGIGSRYQFKDGTDATPVWR